MIDKSAEDIEFELILTKLMGGDFKSGDPGLTEVMRLFFAAGIEFVRGADQVDTLVDQNNVAHMIVVNQLIVPPWMFRDAMKLYFEALLEKFTEKFKNGDLNTTNYLKCLKLVETTFNSCISVDSSKVGFLNEITKAKTKCEVILNGI